MACSSSITTRRVEDMACPTCEKRRADTSPTRQQGMLRTPRMRFGLVGKVRSRAGRSFGDREALARGLLAQGAAHRLIERLVALLRGLLRLLLDVLVAL